MARYGNPGMTGAAGGSPTGSAVVLVAPPLSCSEGAGPPVVPTTEGSGVYFGIRTVSMMYTWALAVLTLPQTTFAVSLTL
ncbi:hypothetical protein EDD98_4846 [Streptomyces sp. PanSC19]|nr:hypothetical protein EDD98_4846 [Streptomyces sp. PanSC19]